MSTKTIWISALNKEQDAARVTALSQILRRYGLQSQGHFWVDEPEKLAWRTALDALNAARADLWLILASPDELAKPSVRYGLSVLAANLREARGAGFPIVLSWLTDATPAAVPPLLAGASVLDERTPAWPAKMVARANVVATVPHPEHRFEVVGEEQLGQWFALGPREGEWQGVVFGVSGGDARIDFQAVGPHGALPEKTVLEYAQEGLTVQVGAREFQAWAVRNRIGADEAYYARVKGRPEAILFMPYSESDDAEATVLQLS
jgi:hypothetical protein